MIATSDFLTQHPWLMALARDSTRDTFSKWRCGPTPFLPPLCSGPRRLQSPPAKSKFLAVAVSPPFNGAPQAINPKSNFLVAQKKPLMTTEEELAMSPPMKRYSSRTRWKIRVVSAVIPVTVKVVSRPPDNTLSTASAQEAVARSSEESMA
jgi:hypothetical protein